MSGSNASSSSVTLDLNTTDSNDVQQDIIVVTIWFFTVIYGLITNFLILIGICRSATMRNSTSYWLILILSFCDVMMLLITLFHLLPSTLWHDAFLIVEEPRNYVTIFIYDTFWYTGVLGLAMMSVNRFASIWYPTQYSRMFSPSNTIIIGVMLFVGGTAISIPALFECCITLWDHHYYVTRFKYEDTGYAYVDLVVNSLSTLVMLISYAFIVMRVRQSRLNLTVRYSGGQTRRIHGVERNTISSREFRLVVQFLVVSGVFMSTFGAWQILPRVSADKWIFAIMTELFFINNGVNPTVYLIFNSQLRKELQTLCGPADKSASSDHLNNSRNNNGKKGAAHRRASCIPMQASSNSDQPEGVQV